MIFTVSNECGINSREIQNDEIIEGPIIIGKITHSNEEFFFSYFGLL